MTTGDSVACAFEQRGALCPIRIAHAQLTARALGRLTAPDLTDEAVSCLPPALHITGALYTPLFGPGGLFERHPFAYLSVSPAALAQAESEGAAAAAGFDFSPASIDEFAARIRDLRVPRSPVLLLGGGGFVPCKQDADGPAGGQAPPHARRRSQLGRRGGNRRHHGAPASLARSHRSALSRSWAGLATLWPRAVRCRGSVS